ncbi:hypothetical protein [Microbacterium sp. 13-71-7]|uniref:hypothetical protein n=1 Tax=Microbacterium sp. 13-71-7 TaxID=1970399 RepID=UPI0025DDAD27|nr:hypothetical protein [Microbacterium sp. 13-71-7]
MNGAEKSWDRGGIVVTPGLPEDLSRPNDMQDVYPSSTLTFVKALRSAGYPVWIANREDVREVSHHSSEVWLPVANFGLDVLAGGMGNVLAGILMQLFTHASSRRDKVHIRWNVQASDGTVHEFAFDGDAETGIASARVFERSLGYGND